MNTFEEAVDELRDECSGLRDQIGKIRAERDAAIRERDEERQKANEWLTQLHDSQKRVAVLERALAIMAQTCVDVDREFFKDAGSTMAWAIAAAEKEGA